MCCKQTVSRHFSLCLHVFVRFVTWQVLLDVTGATNAETCNEKASNIAQNVNAVKHTVQNAESPVKSVIGILLAPNCNSTIVDARVAQVVAGDAARDILGGLQQLLTWLGDDFD